MSEQSPNRISLTDLICFVFLYEFDFKSNRTKLTIGMMLITYKDSRGLPQPGQGLSNFRPQDVRTKSPDICSATMKIPLLRYRFVSLMHIPGLTKAARQ